MKYVPASVGSVYVPKLVGSYESELHPAIEQIVTRNYSLVVNIGCGEGYYAVGFLLRIPSAHGIAYDVNPEGRRLCREMAELNGVAERLEIRGACTVDELRALAVTQAFIFCDCEGAEIELLDPKRVPNLSHCDMLVEVHDFIVPRTSETIRRRFAFTHHVQFIRATRKTADDYPGLSFLHGKDRQVAVEEFRPHGMSWVMLSAKAQGLVKP